MEDIEIKAIADSSINRSAFARQRKPLLRRCRDLSALCRNWSALDQTIECRAAQRDSRTCVVDWRPTRIREFVVRAEQMCLISDGARGPMPLPFNGGDAVVSVKS